MGKDRITVTIDSELLEWIDRNIAEKVFANRSHAFEFILADSRRSENA